MFLLGSLYVAEIDTLCELFLACIVKLTPVARRAGASRGNLA
jgi:hypothetical protein